MHAARLLYSSIGDQVARNGFDSVNQRAVVPLRVKLRRLMDLFGVGALSSDASTLPALAEAQFLIDAVNSGAPAEMQPPWYRRPFTELNLRIGWLFDLYGELDVRDRQLEKE
jgi:phytoene synthase